MKIIAGQLKGRNFYMPAEIRPTQGLLRAAIFDLIGHDIEGLTFLDLFAGSGAVALEALSRGAKEVTMVEHNPKNAEIIRENCELLQTVNLGPAFVIQGDAFATIKEFTRENRTFDLVFFDPPFGLKLAKKTLKLLGTHDILHGQSLVIAQYDKKEHLEIPEHLKVITQRLYGSSYLTIFQKVTI